MNNRIELSKKDFRRMQLIELDLLAELDRVCRLHNISYTLCSGSMLGAIRHHGIIPWDDDIDVCMLREEYERFKSVGIKDLDGQICFFQDHTTDPDYRWGFAKLRRKGTTYIRTGQEHCKYKTGIFIDIIPYDDIPHLLFFQILQDRFCFCLRKILWSEVGKENEKGFLKLWYKILSLIPKVFVYKLLDLCIVKNNLRTNNRVRGLLFPAPGEEYGSTLELSKRYGMPKKWFLNRCEYEFEGIKVFGIKDYDEYLRYKFGDYLKLPPLEKRKGNAPVSYIDMGDLYE